MNQDKDKLARLEFDAAFAETPEEIALAVHGAAAKIRAFRQRRRALLSVAAVLLAMAVGISALLASRGGHRPEDAVLSPVVEDAVVAAEVWTSREDGRYHSSAQCPGLVGNAVRVQRITALEFEKTPCPECEEERP